MTDGILSNPYLDRAAGHGLRAPRSRSRGRGEYSYDETTTLELPPAGPGGDTDRNTLRRGRPPAGVSWPGRVPPSAHQGAAAPCTNGPTSTWPSATRPPVRGGRGGPHVEGLEHGDLPPYDIIRKLYATFGLDQLARDGFTRQVERKRSGGRRPNERRRRQRRHGPDPDRRAVPLLPRHRDRPRRQHRPGRGHDHEAGHGRPDGALGPRPADHGQGRRVGHHRARLGVRRLRRHEVDGVCATATSTS